MNRRCILIAALLSAAASLHAQGSFVNYESSVVHPIEISSDGLRLYTVLPEDNRLAVFSLRVPARPFLLYEIPVGLEPVSVRERAPDEIWVVNQLSDSVSVVSLSARRVIATLRVVDEPADVVFAGGNAYVSVGASDRVDVFDVTTHVRVGAISIRGKDPRSLAVANDGSKVYALIRRSGNGTTLVPAPQAPSQPAPTNQNLPPPPQVGLIVRADDPMWSGVINYTVPDNDVAEIDTATRVVSRYFKSTGTTNFDIEVHGTNGDLYVANTEAFNLVHFEPNHRGRFIDSRLTRVTPSATPVVLPIDLNPTINRAGQQPDLAARAIALAEPTGLAVDAAAGLIYVAAYGTDRVAVTDLNGVVQARIEMGGASGSQIDTHNKRGPRDLVRHPSADTLYVYNRLSATLSVVSTTSRTVLREMPLTSWDPVPDDLRLGRRFLHEAKNSGFGLVSCASCHVDGETDGLSWDLGDRGGDMQPHPTHPNPTRNAMLRDFHPMKGPLVTQTLKGLLGAEPLHWRGDKANFAAFNGAFDSLLGGSSLQAPEMTAMVAWANSVYLPPNPQQQLDRTYLDSPPSANAQRGFELFTMNDFVSLEFGGTAKCADCHIPFKYTNGLVEPRPGAAQDLKPPPILHTYRKAGFVRAPGQTNKAGFGFLSDGAAGLTEFLLGLNSRFIINPQQRAHLEEFLLAADTGTAPTVGYEVTVDSANANSTQVTTAIDLLRARAVAADIDLVAQGVHGGVRHGLLYDAVADDFVGDAAVGFGPFTWNQLQTAMAGGSAAYTFRGVPPGSGVRLGVDRDLDSVANGDDGIAVFGQASPMRCGTKLNANSEPRIGNGEFALVSEGPAGGFGIVVASGGRGTTQFAGVTLLVDLFNPIYLQLDLLVDARGTGFVPLPLPNDAQFVGLVLNCQAVMLDACGPGGISASGGLEITVRP